MNRFSSIPCFGTVFSAIKPYLTMFPGFLSIVDELVERIVLVSIDIKNIAG